MKNGTFGLRHSQEGENERAEHGQRDGAKENDERIAETVELRREDEKDEDEGESERGQELVALDAQLARLAGVIDRVALGQNPGGFVFQHLERLIDAARSKRR